MQASQPVGFEAHLCNTLSDLHLKTPTSWSQINNWPDNYTPMSIMCASGLTH